MKIVQIGACRGNDHVTKLIERQSVDFLLLVEANPLNIEELNKCYKDCQNCIIKNTAIGLENKQSVSFYYSIYDGPLYEVSSLDKQHIIKHGYKEDSIKSFDIECITLNDLFSIYQISDLDYLFLDIEGLDAEVSLQFNPSQYNIQNIQIEILHLGSRLDSVMNHYLNHGYSVDKGIDFYGYDKMFKKNKE